MIQVLGQTRQATDGEALSLVLFVAIICIVLFLLGVILLRWMLRLSEMAKYQREMAEDLNAIRRMIAAQCGVADSGTRSWGK